MTRKNLFRLLFPVSSHKLFLDPLETRRLKRATRRPQRLKFESLEARRLLAVGQGFNLNAADLAFIVDQTKIAEAHAASATVSNACGTLIGTGEFQIPAAPNAVLQPLGLRTIDGTCNNLVSGQEDFGSADRPFSRLTTPYYREAEDLTFDPDGPGGQEIGDPTSYAQKTGVVQDSQPRLISNLIVDQTGLAKGLAPVHDAMSDREQLAAIAEHIDDSVEGRGVVGQLARGDVLSERSLIIPLAVHEAAPRITDALGGASCEQGPLRHVEELVLERGASGVENQDSHESLSVD